MEASEDVATQFLAAVEARFAHLLLWPLSGASRDQLAPALRAIFHRAYAIYYMPEATGVVIVRVIHGARDAAALGERRGFETGGCD